MTSGSVDQLTIPVKEDELVKLMDDYRLPIPVVFKFDLLNSIHFKFFGYTKIGSITRGSSEKTDVFLFKCHKHGLRLSTASSWSNHLLCNSCLDEIGEEIKKLETGVENATDPNDKETLETNEQLKKYLNKNTIKNK